LLSVHYRQKLNFTFDSLEAAKSAVQRLNDFVLRLESARAVQDNKRVSGLVKRLLRRFEKAMDADLEMSQALAAVFDFSSVVNSLLDKGKLSKNDAIIVIDAMRKVDKVLGVLSSREEVPQDIAQLVDEREKARAIKNFARADELREMLKSKGWVVEDTDYGPRIKHA
jgi:cysteinyl-tRNA synthetase